MKAKIYVTLKPGVLDPQGKAVAHSLHDLGFDEVENVRQGKYLEVELTTQDKKKAAADLEEMCKKLLSNTVIENYRIELE
jgi:phosphoribosylformylglycinamidine synthase